MADSDFPKPPDVPDYVPVPAVWDPAGTPVYRTPGTAPGYANELPEPNPTNYAGWIETGPYDSSNGFKTQPEGAGEAKMRTHINFTHVLKDDPIRNYGRPGTSHWHTFLGNRHINAWSTYKSARMHPESNAAGGPINGTGYWIPSFLVPLAEKTYAKIPDFSIVYYQSPIDEAVAGQVSRLPFGIRYVAGVNMDDHHEDAVRAEIAASGGGYSNTIYNGFDGYSMSGPGGTLLTDLGLTKSKHLKNADGSDPWMGQATSEYTLNVDMTAPEFWDGVNLWSPGGYKHFRYAQGHTNSGLRLGPENWVRVPKLQLKFAFTHGGFADYGTWRLSSDDHAHMVDPNHAPMLNGASFHADWLGAWDQVMMTTWQRNGQGVEGFTPHEMNDSIMSANAKLIVGQTAPDGRSPQVNLNQKLASIPANMILLPTVPTRGPFNVRGRGN